VFVLWKDLRFVSTDGIQPGIRLRRKLRFCFARFVSLICGRIDSVNGGREDFLALYCQGFSDDVTVEVRKCASLLCRLLFHGVPRRSSSGLFCQRTLYFS
jgi:hypothetical protein